MIKAKQILTLIDHILVVYNQYINQLPPIDILDSAKVRKYITKPGAKLGLFETPALLNGKTTKINNFSTLFYRFNHIIRDIHVHAVHRVDLDIHNPHYSCL